MLFLPRTFWEFDARLRRLAGTGVIDYVAEPKLDGPGRQT
jgi:NAD-dependent DNA ligase